MRFNFWRHLALPGLLCCMAILTGALNWLNQFILVSLIYLIAGYGYAKKGVRWVENVKRAVWAIAPFLLIYTPVSIYIKSYQTFPIWIFAMISLIVGAFLKGSFYLDKRKLTYGSLYALLIVGLGRIGMPNWITFVFEQKPIIHEMMPEVLFTDQLGNQVKPVEWKGKVVVLDFWTTSCSSCIKKFPDLEELSLKFKDSEDVLVFAVNIPLKRDTPEKINDKVKAFNFNKLSTSNWEEVKNQLKIEFVPTVILVDKKGNLRFRGGYNTGLLEFVANFEKQLKKLVKEG